MREAQEGGAKGRRGEHFVVCPPLASKKRMVSQIARLFQAFPRLSALASFSFFCTLSEAMALSVRLMGWMSEENILGAMFSLRKD